MKTCVGCTASRLDAGRVLGDHAGVRASSLLVTSSLLVLACADPASEQPAPRSEPAPVDEVQAVAEVQRAELVLPPSIAAESPIAAPAPTPNDVELPPSEAAPEPEPADPLAPILPSGPEPGSPESDAELAELLEESTLTQEEFDAAFRKNKPQIAGDQFVFGPGDRTRKGPVVAIGTPKIDGAKISAAKISELAEDHLRGFEGCLAVALTDNPEINTSVTLRVRFDAKGEVDDAKVEGGAAGASLRECLAAVADNWSLAGAAGASVEVLLSLRSE